MTMINDNKDHQWKFQRTEIWLRFFNYTGLPAPFNIFDALINLLNYRKHEQDTRNTKKCKTRELMKYINLVSKLTRRYIHNMEDSHVSDATREDLENAKREILKKLRRATLT
eukprot:GFUD01047027.1.p1 GENE.GFUD01047027.1~~GFUD01047027.1.p1  ORF type:complete len:112 (+),score=35.10 GFUD01047027.1:1-336(+)